jgi:hypothetical protein
VAAAVGLGLHSDLEQAASRMAKPGRRFLPRARFAHGYAQRAAQYAAVKQFALDSSGST